MAGAGLCKPAFDNPTMHAHSRFEASIWRGSSKAGFLRAIAEKAQRRGRVEIGRLPVDPFLDLSALPRIARQQRLGGGHAREVADDRAALHSTKSPSTITGTQPLMPPSWSESLCS